MLATATRTETLPMEVRLITGEELLAMGDIGPSELIDGRIVRMPPTAEYHGAYEGNFYKELRAYVDKHELGKVRVGEVGIFIHRNPDRIRAADALFISNERAARRSSSGFMDVAPELVVEILSPDDAWSDVIDKLRDYFSAGVLLVWVADPKSRSVFAYRSLTDVNEFTENDDLPGEDVLPGFKVRVSILFEE